MFNRPFVATLIIILVTMFCSASIVAGPAVRLSVNHAGLVGQPAGLTITADSLGFDPGGFDLLLAYDQTAAALYQVIPGQFVEDCQWDYFTYRIMIDTAGVYDLGELTHLLRISARAGDALVCPPTDSVWELAQLDFIVSMPHPGNNIECQWLPIRFFWRDCDDNVLFPTGNDTVYTGAHLFEYYYPDPIEMTLPFPGFGVPQPPCPDPPGQVALDTLSFYNGGINVLCPTYLRGDVNLNGIHYELADAVLFMNYFIWGIPVFTIYPPAQMEQCDINFDGIIGVNDLVLMVRIISGYLPPILNIPKVWPQGAVVSDFDGRTWRLGDLDREVAAVYSRWVGTGAEVLMSSEVSFTGPEFEMGRIGDTTTMLLLNTDGSPVLAAGSHQLIQFDRPGLTLLELQVVDVYGRSFRIVHAGLVLPDNFELHQNYPNPFNPSTNIAFYLADRSDWHLSVFNIKGQIVRQFSGQDQGQVTIEWDGTDAAGHQVASGVYFYRLDGGYGSAARKMILLR